MRPRLLVRASDEPALSGLASIPPVRDFLGQFNLLGGAPAANPYATARDARERQDQWEAIAAGSQADRATYQQLLRGLAHASGAKRGPQFERAIGEASGHVAKIAPYAMAFTPKLWDRLHGSRGSAAALAGSFQRAHPERTPVENAAVASEVHRRVYGNPETPQPGLGAPGFSARELGQAYEDASYRGLFGGKSPLTPEQTSQRLSQLAAGLNAVRDVTNTLTVKASAEKQAVTARYVARILNKFLESGGKPSAAFTRSVPKRIDKAVARASTAARAAGHSPEMVAATGAVTRGQLEAQAEALTRANAVLDRPNWLKQQLRRSNEGVVLADAATPIADARSVPALVRQALPELNVGDLRVSRGVPIGSADFSPETRAIRSPASWRTLAHELGHAATIPDLATNARLGRYGAEVLANRRFPEIVQRLAAAAPAEMQPSINAAAGSRRAWMKPQMESYRLADLRSVVKRQVGNAPTTSGGQRLSAPFRRLESNLAAHRQPSTAAPLSLVTPAVPPTPVAPSPLATSSWLRPAVAPLAAGLGTAGLQAVTNPPAPKTASALTDVAFAALPVIDDVVVQAAPHLVKRLLRRQPAAPEAGGPPPPSAQPPVPGPPSVPGPDPDLNALKSPLAAPEAGERIRQRLEQLVRIGL